MTSVSKTHSSAFNSLELPVFEVSTKTQHTSAVSVKWIYRIVMKFTFHFLGLNATSYFGTCVYVFFTWPCSSWPCNQSSAFDPSKVGPVSIQYASHVTLFRQPALQCNLSNREVDKPGLKPVEGLMVWDVSGNKKHGKWLCTRVMIQDFWGFMNQLQRMQCQGLKHQSKHHHLHTKRQDYNVDNGHHTTTET